MGSPTKRWLWDLFDFVYTILIAIGIAIAFAFLLAGAILEPLE